MRRAPRLAPDGEPYRQRSRVALVGYGAVTAFIAGAFLLQILVGVCPVP